MRPLMAQCSAQPVDFSQASLEFVFPRLPPLIIVLPGFQADTQQVREAALFMRELRDMEALKNQTRAFLSAASAPPEASVAAASSADPVYCYCRSQSHGNMIECENLSCPIGWFHFACVHLQKKPSGQWYCPDCRKGGTRSSTSAPSSTRKRKR